MTTEARCAHLVATHDRSFWLDGGGARDWSGRRSMVGWLDEDDLSLTLEADGRVLAHRAGDSVVVGDDIFEVLSDQLAGEADPHVHWVGYFGYASRRDLPAAVETDLVPTAVWMRSRHVEVVDHSDGAAPHPTGPFSGSSEASIVDPPPDYIDAFDEVQEALHAGDSYETNLTYRVEIESDLDPVAAYVRLRALNPAPYAGLLRHRGAHLLSSSPERFVTIDRDRLVETKPIKGTTPRSPNADEDERRRSELAHAAKFRSENLMIVDLLRNDLAMVCEPGSVTVPVLMEVESYASVHQLVSTVRGRLRSGVGTVEAIASLFPAGSMTGAPKLRTMDIIERVEGSPRGAYSGAFGWISSDGRADLGVIIRSLVTDGSGRWRLGTGGGITVASEVCEEYAESRWKAERLLRVFD